MSQEIPDITVGDKVVFVGKPELEMWVNRVEGEYAVCVYENKNVITEVILSLELLEKVG